MPVSRVLKSDSSTLVRQTVGESMQFLNSTAGRFSLRIALPAFVVLAGTLATVFLSLQDMAGEVNRIEQTLTGRSVEAAVQSQLRRMGDSNGDYAQWDDAVRKLYGKVDPGFVEENFKLSTATPVFFDTAYLIDETGHDVFAFQDGETITVPSSEAFGPALATMTAALPSDGRSYAVKTGLIRGKWGLEVVAVGPVVPASPDFVGAPARSRFLVLAKAFNLAMLKRLGEDFLIEGLRFTSASAAGPRIDLHDPTGAALGALAWTPRRLGTEAHARVSPAVLMMLALLSITMGFLMLVAIQGMREVEKKETEARYVATHDGLTDLPNRFALVQALDAAMTEKRAGGKAVAVVYLDLDGFKEINDAYGHETGNVLLKRVAAGFKAACGDLLLTRVGGDEFVVLIVGHQAVKLACDIGWKLIRSLGQPFDIDGRLIAVGTSVGVAVADVIDPTAEELLRRADVAMYQAKQQGPNRMFVYDALIDTIRHERLDVADDLRRALAGDGLALAYQPVFDAATREVVGAEALVRWNRPHFGPLPPAIFVPIAEETGLIDQLGTWILRRACLEALPWGDLRLSVNVSPAQFRNPNFESLVSSILAETGFPVSRLELEVTESYFVAHPDQARMAIDAIRSLGISVALDDFGTGFSSIGYLRSFAFDKLKLDRSMIAGIVTDERARRLVQATIALADALELTVTAEGVEVEEEAALLRLAGCREFQGFFFAKPESAAQLTERLRRRVRKEEASSLQQSA
jgi:diguanylate cyclase (GGDEF)-like protein